MYKTFRRVTQNQIELNKPLPFSIYSRSGMILMKVDDAISSHAQMETLLATGYYYDYSGSKDETARQMTDSVFTFMDHIKGSLDRLLEKAVSGIPPEDWQEKVLGMAQQFQLAVTKDSNAALASFTLDADSPYKALHHGQAAIICEILARKRHVSTDDRLIMVAAALTHDIGLLEIQDELDYTQDELDDDLKGAIRKHTQTGEEILRGLGVQNTLWLRLVRGHHERLDGSGYPDGLTGEDIDPMLRIFMLADSFCAMVRDRPYRKAILPRYALRHMLVEQGEKIDPELTKLLIKEIGLFPPGTIVTLNNGEIAVVAKPRGKKPFPLAMSFAGANGLPRENLASRETGEDAYAIVGMDHFSSYKKWRGMLKKIWL